MFTQAELNALTAPLSNRARVLYCLGLRIGVTIDTQLTKPIRYKTLLALVNGDNKSKTITLGREINAIIEELIQAGLVAIPTSHSTEQSLNGECLQLPLVKSNTQYISLHQEHVAMHKEWLPEQSVFEDIAALMGMIDKSYTSEEKGEFVSYWLGRPEAVLSIYQWTQKFTHSLKNKRAARGYKATQTIGHQTVKVEPGIKADDNAKQLVAKYANKQSGK